MKTPDTTPVVANDTTQEIIAPSVSPHASPKKHGRHEPLFGKALLVFMLLFTLGSIGGVGWIAYAKWQDSKEAGGRPSISALVREPSEEEKKALETESAQETKEASASKNETKAAVTKGIAISVLNGGATKGAAGVLTELLTKEGFTKVTPGNTGNNYTGVTVYHAAISEKEAEAVKEIVAKTYPDAGIKAAIISNKETSLSPITVIIGK